MEEHHGCSRNLKKRKLLESGRWVGHSGYTWDKWIPNHPTNMVIHPPQDDEWEWRVVELIDWTTRTWDRQLVEMKFYPEDAEAILGIPLSRRMCIDKLFWLHNREGKYTVKSRYHLAKQLGREADSQGECSNGVGVNPVWSKLWQLKISNKIKIFRWMLAIIFSQPVKILFGDE